MNEIYLIKYCVKGIKNLDDWAELLFYNKTIKKSFSMQKYNIKGIYGTNGAGKSGIIRSAEIFKYLILDPKYLSDEYVQRQLNDLINKTNEELKIKADYLFRKDKTMILYHYEISLKKDNFGLYEISEEKLSFRNATSANATMKEVYSTLDGILNVAAENKFSEILRDQTKNLLTEASLCAVFRSREELIHDTRIDDNLWNGIASLIIFCLNLYVCMEQGDDHRSYYIDEYLYSRKVSDSPASEVISCPIGRLNSRSSSALSVGKMAVKKELYPFFEKEIQKLYEFVCIFKDDLRGIEIDRREDKNLYICTLVMKYEKYKINAEFESTGIKKLIRLFDYLNKMVQGNIVFIDEFDSNLHDVYLCALLEYLMDHAKGQLCFTTHNIGPMDVLKKHRKSIDFLSTDHKIYSWTKNGNYSPSSLYKSGMIEGSAFNVFSFDFIHVFQSAEDN